MACHYYNKHADTAACNTSSNQHADESCLGGSVADRFQPSRHHKNKVVFDKHFISQQTFARITFAEEASAQHKQSSQHSWRAHVVIKVKTKILLLLMSSSGSWRHSWRAVGSPLWPRMAYVTCPVSTLSTIQKLQRVRLHQPLPGSHHALPAWGHLRAIRAAVELAIRKPASWMSYWEFQLGEQGRWPWFSPSVLDPWNIVKPNWIFPPGLTTTDGGLKPPARRVTPGLIAVWSPSCEFEQLSNQHGGKITRTNQIKNGRAPRGVWCFSFWS